MPVNCPFTDLVSYELRVQPQWIDNNNHLNMGYYVVVFDDATTGIFKEIGLDQAHRKAQNVTTFSLEAHVTYDREVLLDDPIIIYTRLLDFDAKRIHYMHFMYHAEDGYLASTNELMSLHVHHNSSFLHHLSNYYSPRRKVFLFFEEKTRTDQFQSVEL